MSEENAKELSKQEYWDGRYGQRDEHEWFMEYVDLQELFTKLLPSAQDCPQLLHLGCGTSVSILAFGVIAQHGLTAADLDQGSL